MKNRSLSLLALGSLITFSSCSSSPKTPKAEPDQKSAEVMMGESFPYGQYWNCVVKARGKTFYGQAGNAIGARAQAQNDCSAKFKRNECNPVLCEMKDADSK